MSSMEDNEALTKMLYLATMEVTHKQTMRVANLEQILGQPVFYFEDRLAPHWTKYNSFTNT
jgi:putative transposase